MQDIFGVEKMNATIEEKLQLKEKLIKRFWFLILCIRAIKNFSDLKMFLFM